MNVKSLTLKESQLNLELSLLHFRTEIKNSRQRIEDFGDFLPGAVMIQDLNTPVTTYMNAKGCEILDKSLEEIVALGNEYFNLFFPKEEVSIILPELLNFIKKADFGGSYSFFQRVRANSDIDYKWYLTTSSLYQPNLDDCTTRLMLTSVEVREINYGGRKISHLFCDNEYFRKYYLVFNKLSKREKEIIKLIVDGLTSSDISETLFISIHTVNNHRKSILAKLRFKTLSELVKFGLMFDLGGK